MLRRYRPQWLEATNGLPHKQSNKTTIWEGPSICSFCNGKRKGTNVTKYYILYSKCKCTNIQMTKLYPRFLSISKHKCTSLEFRIQKLKLSKLLCNNHVCECTSMNSQHLKNIISIINTLYGQLNCTF